MFLLEFHALFYNTFSEAGNMPCGEVNGTWELEGLICLEVINGIWEVKGLICFVVINGTWELKVLICIVVDKSDL